jgi:hypothetical protein
MPVWEIILIVGIVVVVGVAIGAIAAANRRKKSEGLKERFGPEYERTVSLTGEPKAAEKELAERERKRKKLDIRPLPAASLDGFVTRWRAVQTAFVDHPASAVGEADVLVTEVMRERGYPVDDDFEQQAADISVDHPSVVNNYRAAHDIYLSQQQGDVGTEAQRQAFVHYRVLFDKLLETEQDTTKSQEATA